MNDVISRFLAAVDGYGWSVQVFGIVLVTLVLGAVVRRFVLHLRERASSSSNLVGDAVAEALTGPARGLIWALGLAFAAHMASRTTDQAIFDVVPSAR